jgi:hypothetical protein
MSVRGAGLVSAGAAALLAASALVAAAPGAVGEEPDTTAPATAVRPELEVGGQVTRFVDYICDDTEVTEVPFRVRYRATDPTGVFVYNRWELAGDTSPSESGGWYEDGTQDPWHSSLRDYRGACGGNIPEPAGWAVTAYDGADNAKYVGVSSRPRVYQEDGVSLEAEGGAVTATRRGTWRTATGGWASGGSQAWTRQQGATATFRVPVTGDLGGLGLVMAQGPARGRFQVRVDGDLVATVDSRADANRNRVVMWQAHVGPGTHTLTVRNLATAGRPRIDLDAVVAYSPFNVS